MAKDRESEISLHGDAAHSARINQQGQGYQLNIEQAFLDVHAPLSSLWSHQFEDWTIVREIDPLELGVHRAPINHGNAVPPYITRDIDVEIQDKISYVCRRGGLIVLVGDSTAGKTRSAYEALLTVAPERHLFQPYSKTDLAKSLLALINNRQNCVVWFDDLEQYLGSNGLTPTVLVQLKRAGIAMVATMRGAQYLRFLRPVDHVEQDSHTVSDFQKIIDQSYSVFVARLWSQTEVSRAKESDDIRILEAVSHSSSFGVAEYLAAGPALLDEWSIAWGAESNPRGASLIAAAVDCARAGIDIAIPRDLLVDLHEVYLKDAGGELLRPEGLDQAFTWATRRRSGVASPLISIDSGQSYRAFDYLVDALMRRKPEQPVPEVVWHKVLEFAGSHPDVLAGIATAARRNSIDEIELKSWEALADSGNSLGAMKLASIAQYRSQNNVEAMKWYEVAANLGEPDGWTHMGLIYEKRGDNSDAEDHFRQAANAGNTHGMNHLAQLLRKNGQVQESENWYRKALTINDQAADLSINLARLLSETGRLDEAEAVYRNTIDRGQLDAMAGLGNLLARSGRSVEARALWSKGVEQGVAEAAEQLALHADPLDFNESERWWRRAIELGSETAVMRLAMRLHDTKPARSAEADELFQQAIELEVNGAKCNYAAFLLNIGRFTDAERQAREAIDENDDDGDGFAAFILARTLEARNADEAEIVSWLERAAEAGHQRAQMHLGGRFSEAGDLLKAKQWLDAASDTRDPILICELGWVHVRLGNRNQAESLYIESFDAGHAHAACMHGKFLVRNNEIDAAIERFRAAYSAGHTHAATMLEDIYRRLGQGRQAAEWMRRSKNDSLSSGRRKRATRKPSPQKRRKRRKR